MKGMPMRRFHLRKYSYVVLWLGLALAIGLVWLLGGAQQQVEKEEESVSQSPEPSAAASEVQPEEGGEELLGVWVPYLSLETEEHTREAFEENFKTIAGLAKELGLNALFVHVRPFCDALYPSDTFPWSHILTGTQGQDPGYDPLAFLVDYTHQLGMEFHAWINPLRVATADTPGELCRDSPYQVLKEDTPYYFMEWEGGLYLDPAYPYVRAMVAQGAAEILESYPVDGIHFDDYFYPSQDPALDQEGYQLYTETVENPLPLLEWRQANISALVQEVYQRVKAVDPQAAFGISPQGNIQNDENMGADVRTWCAVPGYVDYLCPQLYYSFENQALGYQEALEEWAALPRHPGLRLDAGLALYKAGSDADQGTWLQSDDNIRRQIQAARAAGYGGVVLYSADYLEGEQTRQEVENAMAVLEG